MHFLQATLLFAVTVASTNIPDVFKRETCSTPSGNGNCQSTSSCTGFSVAGYCSGSSSNQCCIVQSCSANGKTGTCKNTTKGCSGGTFVSGACPGDSTVQCCVSGSGGGSSGIPGFDISAAQTSSFWSCAAQNYRKVAIRGYQQACGSGGQVDKNLVSSYNAARAAGITNIDIYMFPCTGTQPTGVACKSPSTQINEFVSAIQSNGLQYGTLWFDIEPTSGECNAWNLSKNQNLALAQQYISLIRNTGLKWGVYANGNQWDGIFPSRSTDIGSDLPLWAVQADGSPGVNTVTTFMGGWTSAVAKQYSENVSSCGGSKNVDLDSFAS